MKSLKYIIAFSLTLPLGACEKLLDVQPKSAISDTQTIVDKASAETALRGVYSALADGSFYGTGFQSIGYLSGDNVQWTGSQSQVQEFINHKVNADNSTVSNAWTAIYRTINRANNVLAKVPQVATNATFSETLRNQIIGEAYFIRALAYFDLARTWGGVPIITNPTQSPTENWNVPKSTAAETYAQVLADLDLAEPLLPETTKRFQATRKTVWALKARYFLYQQDYAKAEEYASKLIGDAANYQLLKPYSAFFANNVRGTQESVFEIFYSATETNAHRNQWQPQTNGGTRQWAPNSALVELLNNPVTGGSRSALIAKDNQNRWYGNLYYRSPATDPSFVIRIAELYLIRAEARAQQGNITGALADLNAVRDRAELVPVEAVTTEEILLAIENERRLEFAFEPHRWYDLVRTGRAQQVLQVTDTKRFVMPIPAEQLLIDPGLTQNDGY